ncbi:MAG: hypothetical protein OJF50_006751 [Nitrospira sp.]|nr:hypothetical protein [Nitrospira sp.]
MSHPPAFQFYPKQWLGDDAIMLMDWDVRGMHLHLMCIAWQQEPPCTLPDDDTQLRKWCGNIRQKKWNKIREKLLLAWHVCDGRWIQEGLLREYEKQRKYSDSRRSAANSRWQKQDAYALHTDMHMQCSSSSSSSSKKNKREIESRSSSGESKTSPLPPSKRKAVKVPLPEAFAISDGLRDWATARGFPADLVEREFEKFCERNRAKGETYADWDAAFRSWLIRSSEFAPSSTSRPARLVNGTHRAHRERIPL